jgi:hypothetical protein
MKRGKVLLVRYTQSVDELVELLQVLLDVLYLVLGTPHPVRHRMPLGTA